jgi:hypothetical protein
MIDGRWRAHRRPLQHRCDARTSTLTGDLPVGAGELSRWPLARAASIDQPLSAVSPASMSFVAASGNTVVRPLDATHNT